MLLSENHTSFCRILLATLIIGATLTCRIIAMSNEAQIMQNTKLTDVGARLPVAVDYAVFNGHTVLRVQGVNFKRFAQITIVLEF